MDVKDASSAHHNQADLQHQTSSLGLISFKMFPYLTVLSRLNMTERHFSRSYLNEITVQTECENVTSYSESWYNCIFTYFKTIH